LGVEDEGYWRGDDFSANFIGLFATFILIQAPAFWVVSRLLRDCRSGLAAAIRFGVFAATVLFLSRLLVAFNLSVNSRFDRNEFPLTDAYNEIVSGGMSANLLFVLCCLVFSYFYLAWFARAPNA